MHWREIFLKAFTVTTCTSFRVNLPVNSTVSSQPVHRYPANILTLLNQGLNIKWDFYSTLLF